MLFLFVCRLEFSKITWEEKEFNYYVENFGEITKKKALSMFRLEYALQTERENFFSH